MPFQAEDRCFAEPPGVRRCGNDAGDRDRNRQENAMNSRKTIRAWEDPEFRATLSATEQAEMPDPVGGIELTDAELGQVTGGAQSGASVGCNTKTCVTTRGNSQNPCSNC
jgi:mersacidin/lichenicidin family type 2 lantibiotic